jgi:hypothetical protein
MERSPRHETRKGSQHTRKPWDLAAYTPVSYQKGVIRLQEIIEPTDGANAD